ncbi:hypothetical protein ACFLTE_10895, partial [Bacteroidota bacterium]
MKKYALLSILLVCILVIGLSLNAAEKLNIGVAITPGFKIGNDGLFDKYPELFSTQKIKGYGLFAEYSIYKSVAINIGFHSFSRIIKLENISQYETSIIRIRHNTLPISIKYSIHSLDSSIGVTPYIGGGMSLGVFNNLDYKMNFSKNNEVFISANMKLNNNYNPITGLI